MKNSERQKYLKDIAGQIDEIIMSGVIDKGAQTETIVDKLKVVTQFQAEWDILVKAHAAYLEARVIYEKSHADDIDLRKKAEIDPVWWPKWFKVLPADLLIAAHYGTIAVLHRLMIRRNSPLTREWQGFRLPPQSISPKNFPALSPQQTTYLQILSCVKGDLAEYEITDIETAFRSVKADLAKNCRVDKLSHTVDSTDQTSIIQKDKWTHSNDYRSVNWFGERYTFTAQQAACIKVLWEEWEKGGLSVSEKTIGDKAGSQSDRFRLIHSFDHGKHPAWGSMIQKDSKGVFKLGKPSGTPSPKSHKKTIKKSKIPQKSPFR